MSYHDHHKFYGFNLHEDDAAAFDKAKAKAEKRDRKRIAIAEIVYPAILNFIDENQ
jgi:hypothetical protein